MSNTERRETLSVGEVAAVLGISEVTAYRLIREGSFPIAVLRIGRSIRVSRAVLDQYLAAPAAS